jgi:hypothetical protein
MCGLPKAQKFDDLLTTMDKDAVEAFRRVYSHVDDIDLFSGMMSEKPLEGECWRFACRNFYEEEF